MKKKVILTILISLIIFTILLPYALESKVVAQNTVDFEVSSKTTAEGEQITISVDMKDASNFAAGNFTLNYDKSKLKYISSTKGQVLEDGMMAMIENNDVAGKISIAYTADPENKTQLKQAGNLFTVTFKVIGGKGTNADLKLQCTTLKVKDGTAIPYTIKQGTIYVAEYILGDVNGDKRINTMDAIKVLQHISKKITLGEVEALAADTSKDGRITTIDVIKILQYISKKITKF